MTRISTLRSSSVLLTASLGTLLVLADYTAPLTWLPQLSVSMVYGSSL